MLGLAGKETMDNAYDTGVVTDLWAGCCVYRLRDGRQCKRSATELTTWGAFCWQHASPIYATRNIQQDAATIKLSFKKGTQRNE